MLRCYQRHVINLSEHIILIYKHGLTNGYIVIKGFKVVVVGNYEHPKVSNVLKHHLYVLIKCKLLLLLNLLEGCVIDPNQWVKNLVQI
jgi:hypothetical protein